MKKLINTIEEELAHAGETSPITPKLQELDAYRITTDRQLKDEDFLFRLKGTPCFPRRDITAITGQAKSGKTIFVSMLMACCAQRQVLELERICESPLRVMWIDTEQSQQSTQGIMVNRIARLVQSEPFPEDRFFVFNVRSAIVENRYELLATGIEAYHPDMVIIDNVRDFVTDINDGEQAQKLTESLMQMGEANNCNVTAVLHQNRSTDNRGLRGWIGTELTNKAFEMFSCQKTLGKPGVKPTFSIEQSLTRKFDIDTPPYYQVDDEGIPVSCEPTTSGKQADDRLFASYGKADVDTLNQEFTIRHPDNPACPWEWDLRKLFTTALGNRALVGYQDLMDTVMHLSHIRHRPYCEKVFAMAEKARVIRKDQDRCGRIVVMLLPL